VTIRLGAAIALPQEYQVQNKRVSECEQLDDKADPHPGNLVPNAVGRQNRRKQPPNQVPPDDQPHRRKYRGTRPSSRQRQGWPEEINCAEDK
jgi:hypothetical protein